MLVAQAKYAVEIFLDTKIEDARIAEYVRLLNERYSEPQKITYVEPSESAKRYFELYNMGRIFPLTPEEEEELEELEKEE